MKFLKFLLVGVFFGIVLVKSEAVSWYRIYEMFRFESFHMYGIIGTAVLLGVIALALIRRAKVKDLYGEAIDLPDKDRSIARYLLGGTFFGFGWALAGACPGPMYVLFGTGVWTMLVVFPADVLGPFVSGLLKKKWPN